MKKILLATTALAMTAGMAAADVRLSGDGRMGASYNGTTWDLNGRARVSFTLSATGDHGLTFGGTLRAAQNFGNGAVMNAGTVQNGSVWIQGAGLRLTMGDINDAVRHRMPVFGAGLGYTGGLRGPSIAASSSGDDAGAGGANKLRADYSFSGVGVSASILGNGNNPAIAASFNGTQMGSLPGFTASAGALFVTGGSTEYWLAAGYTFSDITVGAIYNHNGTAGAYRLNADYTMGDLSVGLRYSNGQAGSAYGAAALTQYGIGASYGLGGGARIHAAVASRQAAATTTLAEIGVTFAF